MKVFVPLLMACSLVVPALAQTSSADPHAWRMTAADTPVRISEHVWMIKGMPNIGIVVGTKAVLVVDTGMGPKMGAMAAGFAQKLAPGKRLYLTTTHFHPEHAAGDSGFPADTILIRNDVQQNEVESAGMGMVKFFMSKSEENRELLKDVKFRTPDVTFHREAEVDLGGGVVAKLMWLGPAHTVGDELTLVAPDATLLSGDVVQNETMPMIFTAYGKGGTPTTWLDVMDQIGKLEVKHVVPDHSLPGDGSLVAKERELIVEIRSSAMEMRGRGVSEADAAKAISAKLKAEHPGWFSTDATTFVHSVWIDPAK